MRNYVIINGVNSLTIQGLAIKTLPPITKPIQRNLREEIDGRDGDIVTTLGYGAYDKTIEIGLFGTFDIDEVIAFFNQKGTITFSNEADKVYYFEALDQVDYAELLKFRTANVVLHCQPFKYPLNETPLVEEYEYVNGSGTNLTLNNTSEAIFNKIELQGNTYQEQTTGINMLGLVDGTYTSNGITGVVSNGEITINGTATANSFLQITWESQIVWDITKQYTISAFNPVANSNIRVRVNNGGGMDTLLNVVNATKTITPNNTDMVSTGITIRIENGATITNFKLKPMIELGSTAHEYEQFTYGASPNPQFPQPIQVVSGDNEISICGKNLLSGSLSQFDNQGGTGTTYSYFKLDESKTYTLSATAKDNITVATNHYIGMTYNGGNATGSYTWLISQGQTFTKGQKVTLTSNQKRRYISIFDKTLYDFEKFVYNTNKVLDSDEILIEKKTKKGLTKTIDIKTSIGKYRFEDENLFIVLKTGKGVPLRADTLMNLIAPDVIFDITRTKFLTESLHEL